ncbi:uncharacterized protein [Primulina huaijiensis]|uniref:uncharacterized protein isoform X1 n=1 Tax=Primulina huaijiensis TaxID=1492673 RepID=UPI003CC74BAA
MFLILIFMCAVIVWVQVNEEATSCWVYVAPGSRIYKIRISLEDSDVGRGKKSLLIPEQTQVLDAAVVNRCPHQSEIQSTVRAESEDVGCSLLGSVDSYGHLIVSKIDSDGLAYSISPREIGVVEGSWSGLYFNSVSPSDFCLLYVFL